MTTVTASVELTEASATTTHMLGEAYSYVIPLAERIVSGIYSLFPLL